MQSGETDVEVKALRRLGFSISGIARQFGMSRNTVYRELESTASRATTLGVVVGALSNPF